MKRTLLKIVAIIVAVSMLVDANAANAAEKPEKKTRTSSKHSEVQKKKAHKKKASEKSESAKEKNPKKGKKKGKDEGAKDGNKKKAKKSEEGAKKEKKKEVRRGIKVDNEGSSDEASPTPTPKPAAAPSRAPKAEPKLTFNSKLRFNFDRRSVPLRIERPKNPLLHPTAKINPNLHPKLIRAVSIAEERAYAHSQSGCWGSVKDALVDADIIDSNFRPKTRLAKQAGDELERYGFKKMSVTDPFLANLGSVLVFGAKGIIGHVCIRTRNGFVSDYWTTSRCKYPLIGVYGLPASAETPRKPTKVARDPKVRKSPKTACVFQNAGPFI